MSEQDPGTLGEMSVDVENLYREETFTDRRAARIRRMTPVKVTGEDDPARPSIYVGETSVLTQMGALPLSFELEVSSLEEAFAGFPEGVARALEDLNERAREMARDEASRIVVPSGMPPGLGGGAGGGGGLIMK